MPNTSDTLLAPQETEGHESGGTKSLEQDGSYACILPASQKLSELNRSSECNALLQSRTPITLVEDLVEDILSRATNQSVLRKAGGHRQLSGTTSNDVSPASTTAEKPHSNSAGIDTLKQRDPSGSPFTSSSTSEADSSYSDSENDNMQLASTLDKPGQVAIPTVLRTRNEQDTSQIYIPRSDFVTTQDHTLLKAGRISAVLDDAVVVTTFDLEKKPRQLSSADISNATALDTGSLLCLSDGTVLGAVFETFGPVSSPLYVVRFNNADEIPTLARVGAEVKYVEQEMRLVRGRDIRGKGYDASGKHDEEVDAEEFSDDEKERRSKKIQRSGTTDSCVRPNKRAKATYERGRHGRHERGVRKQENHGGEHKYYQHHEYKLRRGRDPVEQGGGNVPSGYHPGPHPYYHNGMFSPHQPQAIVPPPSFPSAFNNNMRNARTMPALYTPGVSISAPSPLIGPPMHPGPAASQVLPTGNYGLPPSEFPQQRSHYRDSSTVSQHSPFLFPEQGWLAPSSGIVHHGSNYTSTYQQQHTIQGQNGPVPGMQPSGLHQLQGPHVWKGG